MSNAQQAALPQPAASPDMSGHARAAADALFICSSNSVPFRLGTPKTGIHNDSTSSSTRSTQNPLGFITHRQDSNRNLVSTLYEIVDYL
jgi:hypothetical protein